MFVMQDSCACEFKRTTKQRTGKNQDVASSEYDSNQRRAAAQVDAKGKYEPRLSEHGIPNDVLAKLLPGDDIVELIEPKVGGGLVYRFTKRVFDIVSCGCALIVLAIPMVVIAAKIKLESPGPVIYSQRRVEQVIIRHNFGSCLLNIKKAQLDTGFKLVLNKSKCAFGRKGRDFASPAASMMVAA